MRNWHDVRMRILIAEDEPLIASFIEKGLAAEGHAIEVAVNGPSAIGIFLAAPADLVILDVMLPGMSGYAVCEAVRRQGNEVPVVMLTFGELVLIPVGNDMHHGP
jgi:DNA-binding response OmpR family regulator